MYLIFTATDAAMIAGILLAFDDAAIREYAQKGVLDSDGMDAFKEFTNQVCGMLDNELRSKLPKPVHLKLTTTHVIDQANLNTVLSEESLNEEALILTAKMRVLGFDDGQFTISLSKLVGEEFFKEVIEDPNKKLKGTILAVDDSNTDLRMVKKFLSNDFKVIVADGANSALSLLQKFRIDLVLMDIFMPGVDGITLCERIKRNSLCDDIPIIICSAAPTHDHVVKAVRAGAADFLVKPLTRQKLLEKINKHKKEDASLFPIK
jgi:PleD family two-component response regulator